MEKTTHHNLHNFILQAPSFQLNLILNLAYLGFG